MTPVPAMYMGLFFGIHPEMQKALICSLYVANEGLYSSVPFYIMFERSPMLGMRDTMRKYVYNIILAIILLVLVKD